MKIGIDLGGSHIGVGVIAEEGKLLAKREKDISFQEEKNKQLIRDTMVSLINEVLRDIQIPIFIIEQIGIGVPGIVKENKIQKMKKYGIEFWDLATELEKHYEIPVIIQNDALCSAKAEKKYGNLKNSKKSVFMCIGTGIGGAILLEDKIFPSEFGHTIIELQGKQCHCGRQGCFETYSSMKVFKEGIIKSMGLKENTPAKELLAILKQEKENREVNHYIENYLHKLLIGISNITNTLNPEKICLGGSFVYFEEILYKKLLEQASILNYQFEKPQIVLAKLQNNAGIIGATEH